MNTKKRCDMVRAMDLIVRHLDNEDCMMVWLSEGVSDGDITTNTTDEDLAWYTGDDAFAGLMSLFLELCSFAENHGGMLVDGIRTEI